MSGHDAERRRIDAALRRLNEAEAQDHLAGLPHNEFFCRVCDAAKVEIHRAEQRWRSSYRPTGGAGDPP